MEKSIVVSTKGMPVVISVGEAAEILGLSRSFAYTAARRGDLPGVRRIGRRYLVSRAELERYLGIEAGGSE